MDLSTVLGFVAAMAMVLVGAIFEGLHLSSLVGPTAFLIVVGGTLGATVMSHTRKDLKHLVGALRMTVFPLKLDHVGTINYLTTMADQARKDGLLSLQKEIAQAPHPVLKVGLTMAVDGGDPQEIREVLQSMVKMHEEELVHAAAVCDTAGGYCPTLGIMGTVMGLVHVMGNLSEPDTLGPAIAVAFLATLYGVAFANLLFLPLGSKIKLIAQQQSHYEKVMIEGVVGLQTGQNPRNLRERLLILVGSAASQTTEKGAKQHGTSAAG